MNSEQRCLPIAQEAILGSDYKESYQRLLAFAAKDPRSFQNLVDFSNATQNLGTDLLRVIQSQGYVYYSRDKENRPKADYLIFAEIANEGIISADYRGDVICLGKFDGPQKLGLQHSFPGFSLVLPVDQALIQCIDPNKAYAIEIRPRPEIRERFLQFIEKDPTAGVNEDELVKEGLAERYCPVSSPTDTATIQSYARLLHEFVNDLMPLLPLPVEIPEVFHA